MKKLIPKTHKDVCAKKRLFMRLAEKTTEPGIKKEYEQAVNHCDRLTARIVEKGSRGLHFFPAFLVSLLCLILLFGGCKTGFGVGVDAELFYPDIKTAKGGVFSDPVESREQSTQHTTGMARNNLPMIGGAK